MSSLACKHVICRPEHNSKDGPLGIDFGGLEMQKLNIPTDRLKETMKK